MTEGDRVQIGKITTLDSESRKLVSLAWNALATVYDPELGIDIVSLGLIYCIKNERDVIKIEMTLTTPGCPASENLPTMALFAAAEAIGDSAEVKLELVWDPPWDPSMIRSRNPS